MNDLQGTGKWTGEIDSVDIEMRSKQSAIEWRDNRIAELDKEASENLATARRVERMLVASDARVAELETQLATEREAKMHETKRAQTLMQELAKWRSWQPDDEALAEMKSQIGDGSSRVANMIYIGALEVTLKRARQSRARLVWAVRKCNKAAR